MPERPCSTTLDAKAVVHSDGHGGGGLGCRGARLIRRPNSRLEPGKRDAPCSAAAGAVGLATARL